MEEKNREEKTVEEKMGRARDRLSAVRGIIRSRRALAGVLRRLDRRRNKIYRLRSHEGLLSKKRVTGLTGPGSLPEGVPDRADSNGRDSQ